MIVWITNREHYVSNFPSYINGTAFKESETYNIVKYLQKHRQVVFSKILIYLCSKKKKDCSNFLLELVFGSTGTEKETFKSDRNTLAGQESFK